MAGIDRITPDSIKLDDINVWNSIRDDTTAIFQYESPFAQQIIKQLFSDSTISKIKKQISNISYIKLFSLGNALIRPCGASIRDDVCNGIINKTGIDELDELLAPSLSYCFIQEDIMKFVMDFCGYTLDEADVVRKAIAKKLDVEKLLEKIKESFYKFSKPKYNLSDDETEKIIKPILKCISDASRYAFSWNHSDAYSYIGYACGWLKYYYPLEFLVVCLNVWKDKEEKTRNIIEWAKRNRISINPPKFRFSLSEYYIDRENMSIYKGIESIKYMNNYVANSLWKFRDNKYDKFSKLLFDIAHFTKINDRQLEILIKLDFFVEFGNSKKLLIIKHYFELFNQGTSGRISKAKLSEEKVVNLIVRANSRETDANYMDINSMYILAEIEEYLETLDIPDTKLKIKMKYQQEYMGYIDIKTNVLEDRNRLFVLDIKPLKIKSTGEIWAYKIHCISIGTGSSPELTLTKVNFDKKPFIKDDIICVDTKSLKKVEKNGFVNWYIGFYTIEM